MDSKFTHLHVHSEFSLLDGFCRIEDLVKEAKNLGMDSLAVTDHGVLFAAVDFYKACLKVGIKPIIGCEVYVAKRQRTQKEVQIDKNPSHLILLAENNNGYKNLMKIVSEGFISGFYYKPRVDHKLLKEYSEGLICLSACIAGEIPKLILDNNIEEAKNRCVMYQNTFGVNNFFLEIQDHHLPQEIRVNEIIKELSKELNIPLVATNDTHYIKKSDAEAHDILLCIQTGTKVNDVDRMRFPNSEFYLKAPSEMKKLFIDVPEAIDNTGRIAERCEVSFDLESAHLPEYGLPIGFKNSLEYLKYLCDEGIANRYAEITEEITERLAYELDIIHKMGFENYFLVVWDFIKYAKDHGIMVGPGRGSAAGSIVSYALDITTLDPLKYNLLFERFLNPERISMPDIDVDFCYERRQEVIDYVVDKYGSDHVAQIITFGTMAARGAVRDVGRALDMSYGFVDNVAKEIAIRPGEAVTIEKAVNSSEILKKMVDDDPEIKKLIAGAQAVEGLSRHASTHAAGVVISDKPLMEYVPLYRNGDLITTQFPMGLLEDLGLIKMDFLGLRTLTVIRDALINIHNSQGKNIDLDQISLEEESVYQMLSRGDALGVFQLESNGMISFMKKLQPSNFEDIIAGISLYRPGPMDQIPKYIENKKASSSITYLHPLLEPILNVSYGCMVYQEQVMQIFRQVAGFSMGRSDLVRRAMSKKKSDVMDREGYVFIHGEVDEGGAVIVPGAIRNGVSETVAGKIYAEMKDFAKYAFNKSHAAAYALIAYQTAWLKSFYPVEFMAALMSSVMDDEKKVAKYIENCKKMGIKVLPPDVNISYQKFSVKGNKICFGLGAIKGLGKNGIEAIVNARKEHGAYKSFKDFCKKVDLKALNKKNFEGLIKAGAFDFTGNTRAQMLDGYERKLDIASQEKKDKISGQISLFDFKTAILENADLDNFPDVPAYTKEHRLLLEKEVLGIYVTGHPLDPYAHLFESKITLNSSMLESYEELKQAGIYDGGYIVMGGIIHSLKKQNTRNGNTMAFINIEDLYGHLEVIAFPNIFQKYRNLLKMEQPVMIRGKINYNEEMHISIICDQIFPLGSDKTKDDEIIENANYDKLVLTLKNFTEKDLIKAIKSKLVNHKGAVPVILYFKEEKKKLVADKGLWVTISANLLKDLKDILGNTNVEVI